jgi:hypothetical protein
LSFAGWVDGIARTRSWPTLNLQGRSGALTDTFPEDGPERLSVDVGSHPAREAATPKLGQKQPGVQR